MVYKKNLPIWERALRVVGALSGAFYLYNQGYGALLSFSVASIAITGFIGFCPMCALVGRKLDG